MSFPVWMTDSSAAEIEITLAPRPALTALLELRRLTTTCLSSLGGNESDGDRDAPTSDRARATIRRQQRGSRPQLQKEVARQAVDVLTNWLKALAKTTEEVDDE